MITRLAALYALLAPTLLFAQATPTPTPAPPLSSYNWAITAPHNLATNPPSMATVTSFVNNLSDEQYPRVCAVRFAPLRPSTGNLTLIVNPCDDSPSPGIDIVDRTSAGFEYRDVEGYRDTATESVAAGPRDLAGNGALELILESALTDYDGGTGHCVATWPVIYAWDGSNYSNVSAQSQYRPFYQQELAAVQAVSPPDDCGKAEAAKLQRLLGGDPNTGLSDAINWANSSDSHEREFAAAILADIHTSQALPYLQTLGHDSNPVLAGIAQGYLKISSNQPDTVDQETIFNPGGL
jgi:hypothetical protein